MGGDSEADTLTKWRPGLERLARLWGFMRGVSVHLRISYIYYE
jgi:hypothetical protein